MIDSENFTNIFGNLLVNLVPNLQSSTYILLQAF